MRQLSGAIALLALASHLLAEDHQPAGLASTVNAATVYLDRAYVTRRADVALIAGSQSLVITNLPPELDEQSLRVTVTGGALVDGVQSHKVFLAQHQEADIRTLEDELKAADAQHRELTDRKAALDKAHAFVDSVQEAPFHQVTGKDGAIPTRPTVEEYQAILVFLNKLRIEQAAESRIIDTSLTDLQPKLEAKRRELEQAKSASRLERREVVITLHAAQAGAGELHLSYLVPGALWVPVYDARTDREHRHLDLDYDAQVQQATGEDWSDVQLTLSATRPAAMAQSPRPEPWYLTLAKPSGGVGYAMPIPNQAGLSSSFGGAADAPPSQVLYQNRGVRGSKALNEAQDNLLYNAVAVDAISRAIEQRSTTAVFVVPGRNSVASTGKPHHVHIARASLAMTTQLHAIPRTSLNAYITGKVVNATDMPILPGTANVFVGPDLIGSASMEFVAPREVASLYLGVDESVKLTRRLEEKDSGVTFFSKRKRLSMAYSIQALNFHPSALEIAIYESMPVSQDERITVDLDTPAPKPQANDRGMMRWDLTIDAGKEGKVAFSYRIDSPSDLDNSQLQELENRLQIRR